MPGKKIHAADQDDCKFVAVPFNQIENSIGLDDKLALARTRQQQTVLRVQSMMNDLRFDGVGIRRECRILHQDFETRFGRMVKRRHHQMKIHRQAVHADDLVWLGADEAR